MPWQNLINLIKVEPEVLHVIDLKKKDIHRESFSMESDTDKISIQHRILENLRKNRPDIFTDI